MLEIPGYIIQRIIGRGGMATVYLAVQESLGRDVALKVLLPALAQDAIATERFLREARFAAQLHHPNIIAIHEVGVSDGNPYMSMAYKPGGTVAQTTQGQDDPTFALRVVRDIAKALDYAHSRGVVHQRWQLCAVGFRYRRGACRADRTDRRRHQRRHAALHESRTTAR